MLLPPPLPPPLPLLMPLLKLAMSRGYCHEL
jgi:hypothetical protein